jgi:hypothetical protein
MTPEKQNELDSIAAERGLGPGEAYTENTAHAKQVALVDKHGIARAKFLTTLLRSHVLQPDPGATDIFLKALDEYDCTDVEAPYELPCEKQGSGTERYQEAWDTGFSQPGDPYGIQSEYVAQSASPNASLPTQTQANAVAAQAQAEEDARKEARIGD